MFYNGTFNQPIDTWNLGKTTSINGMFYSNKKFNQSLANWNTMNVTDMSNVFYDTNFNNNIDNWSTGKVTLMTEMFRNNQVFNRNISSWRVDNVTNMRNMAVYDNYVKSVTLPDYNLDLTDSTFRGQRILQPVSQKNMNLSPLTVTFRTDENQINYHNLWTWLISIKYGQISGDILRNENIKRIDCSLLDNQKRPIRNFYFTNCFLTSLSSLVLQSGTSEEVDFTANFSYEEIKLEAVE
jgi:surface protein